MLEEMHDPVLSQPICQVGSEPPLLSSENNFFAWSLLLLVQCSPVLSMSHSGRSSPVSEEENLSRCACVQNCLMLKSKPLARIGQQNRPQYGSQSLSWDMCLISKFSW